MPIQLVPTNEDNLDVAGASVTQGPTSGSTSPAGGSAPAGGTLPTASITAPQEAGDSLPFTGLDVGVTLGAALLLLGLGFALRRSVRTD